MIEIVEGRGVGAGKSYYVCTRIITHLSQGGTVYASSNYGLKWDETKALVSQRYGLVLEDDQYHVFDADDTHRLHEITPQGTPESPVLIVLDEAQSQLNNRDYADRSKRAFFEWLCQSRHDDNDLIFITQHAANIDRQIARLVTYIIRLRNMKNFKIPGLGAWPLAQFVVNRFDQDGRTLMDRKWIWHDKAIFACYASKVMRGSHKRLGLTIPRRQLRKSNTRKHMRILLFLVVACLGYGGYKVWDMTAGIREPKKAATVTAQSTPIPTPPKTSALPAKAAKPQYIVVKENFRATDEKTYLRTDVAEYRPGMMSPHGFVVAFRENVVRITTPEPGLLYVVAERVQLTPKSDTPILDVPPKNAETADVKIPSAPVTSIERARGGYPAPEDEERIARARAGLPQIAATQEVKPQQSASTGILLPTTARVVKIR